MDHIRSFKMSVLSGNVLAGAAVAGGLAWIKGFGDLVLVLCCAVAGGLVIAWVNHLRDTRVEGAVTLAAVPELVAVVGTSDVEDEPAASSGQFGMDGATRHVTWTGSLLEFKDEEADPKIVLHGERCRVVAVDENNKSRSHTPNQAVDELVEVDLGGIDSEGLVQLRGILETGQTLYVSYREENLGDVFVPVAKKVGLAANPGRYVSVGFA